MDETPEISLKASPEQLLYARILEKGMFIEIFGEFEDGVTDEIKSKSFICFLGKIWIKSVQKLCF